MFFRFVLNWGIELVVYLLVLEFIWVRRIVARFVIKNDLFGILVV